MRVVIRNKHTKSAITNVIRDCHDVDKMEFDNENLVLTLVNVNPEYRAIYPLGINEYITIQPDEE